MAWLSGVFGEVLGLAEYAPDADFFDQGGDSILAARAMMRIRARTSGEVPLSWLFEQRSPLKLAALLEGRVSLGETEHTPAPGRHVDGNARPLSHAQERLWLLHQLDPRTPAYNEPLVYRVRGDLDVPALRTALRHLAERHEILRTSLVPVGDGERPVQRVESPARVDLAVEDLRGEGSAAAEAAAAQRIRTDLATPFDLAAGPLFRATLLRTGDRDAYLLLTFHHVVTDGWSTGLVLGELGEAYGAALHGRPAAPAGALPLQYADFAAWQRGWLEGGAGEQQLAFWERELAGAPEVSVFPADRPRPPVQSYDGGHVRFGLPSALGARVVAASREHDVTVYVMLLSAFLLTLHKYTGQRDVVIGTPIAGRHHPDVDRLVGFFANTVPFRSRYEDRASFAEYVRTVGGTCVGVLDHQDVPFEQIVQRLNLQGVTSHSPLVQTVFAYQDHEEQELSLDGVRTEPVAVNGETSRFDVTLFVTRRPDGSFDCDLEFSADLYDRATAERLVTHFLGLLDQVLDAPRTGLAGHRLCTAAERDRLAAWNDTSAEFPADRCLHALVEDQVRATPDAAAVVLGDVELTYAELDARANRLARHLGRLGVEPDDVVGLCMDRSPELVVGLLAILKAGAAYLPLDPEAPRARLTQITADARAQVCLTLGHQAANAPEVAHLVRVDEDREAFATLSADRPDVAVTPRNLVSVYYTSGSTGAPKGVASTHEGWVNRMVWMQKQHDLRPGETVLHKTTLTFDDSALELFWPLMYGGRIALIEPGLHRDPQAVLAAATAYGTVLLQTVPSMLNLLMDGVTPAERAALSALRNTVSSGEALTPAAVRRFRETMPGALHNTWGATEVSIDSTIRTCDASDAEDAGAVSVGAPFDNNTVHVLDPAFNPLPPGVTGDLYIGGLGLARGYLNDPVKTAQAFVASPFGDGVRLYRTGDQGYLRQDGSIKFTGRNDHQIKIRGMRVELGEIESVLREHERVQDAVVVAQRTAAGHYRLAGYVTGREAEADPDVESLRRHLAQWLPDHMRPPFLLVMDRLPLNANGKVDRHRLPDPAQNAGRADVGRAPLDGPVQRAVAEIWCEVLELDEVGPDDNFFDLGGHSLIATKVTGRFRARFGLELPLRTVFAAPGLRGFAEEVDRHLRQQISGMSVDEMRSLLELLR
ncbi:amino acid adenylation domain-containing protein [Streptomyces sp. DK15]|uniref:amino acid adenylation domain-containing protein n=1 Tax=Streptomyces sp. DK15 TaxID=2957499 RepID=UPI0029A49F0A|nr:amino acid adenylation domain-containing protein [Streptomyces sp. DK15]MDX2391908.1 amino acid adenylation domain-containing protein [Streptomyces sp. DK15]